MASTGFTLPGSGTNNSGIGTVAWSSPGNILTDNGSNASGASAGKSVQMQYLVASDFGFSIPDGSTIDGFQARVQAAYGTAPSAAPVITHIYLVRGGSTLSSNFSSGASLTGSMTDYTFGGSTNLWGLSWTPAQVNASNFQFRFSCDSGVNSGFSSGASPQVDVMWVNVFYTPPAGGTRFYIMG